jgi:hypothetical protein
MPRKREVSIYHDTIQDVIEVFDEVYASLMTKGLGNEKSLAAMLTIAVLIENNKKTKLEVR